METSAQPAPAPAAVPAAKPVLPAALAKGALRRLAQAQLEPTPENYARAYADEAGLPAPAAAADEAKAQGAAWAALVERLAKNLDRGGRQWTAARRKDSLQRLFAGSRSDAARLQQRLQSLITAWEGDQAPGGADSGFDEPPGLPEATVEPVATTVADAKPDARQDADWPPLVAALQAAVQAGLEPPGAAPGRSRAAHAAPAGELAGRLAALADAVAADGATPEHAAAIGAVCEQARRWFAHRHHLIDALSALCRDLSGGLVDLAEDESWAQGQCAQLHASLQDEALSVRGVRAAGALLADTRRQHQRVRGQRQSAREALRLLVHDMLREVAELGAHAGRFEAATAEHAQAVEKADTLDGLALVVKALLADARTVQAAVGASQQRLQDDRERAAGLEAQVRALESELRRLSEEVSTDVLTQVANRRGLMQAFDAESARAERGIADSSGAPSASPASAGSVDMAHAAETATGLAVGLIDIDNFKKLNDSLGHAVGDLALKNLAAAMRERLRPADHLARFGGEEFVVLLPDTAPAEAKQVLTRLQRSLTEALFLHEGREIFVTFSAGISAWRRGEPLQAALERADAALYDAKRSGKNRTCLG